MYVDQWDQRDGSMDLQVDYLTRSEIPDWVKEATDETCGKKTNGKRTEQPANNVTDESTPHASKSSKHVGGTSVR